MTDELVTASRDLPLVLAHTSACASADSLNPVRINTLSAKNHRPRVQHFTRQNSIISKAPNMASGTVSGIQHRARAVEEVLDALERKPASNLLLSLRSHLAALGITRLADVLRWEAFVHLTLAEAAGIHGTVQHAYKGHFRPSSKPQATGHTAHNDPNQEMSHGVSNGFHDSIPSYRESSDVQMSPAIHDEVHPERVAVPSTAGALCKRAQLPHSNSSITRVPLAKRMRQMSSTLRDEAQISAAKDSNSSVIARTCPSHSTDHAPAASTGGNISVAHATHARKVGQQNTVSVTAAAQHAAAQQSAPAPFKSGFAPVPMQPEQSKIAASTFRQHTSAASASLQQSEASGCLPQQLATSSGVSQALLQRWLAYRPPPAHSSGLKVSQCVPGCKFLVDLFSKSAQKSGARHFFLTHFHYDHYMGLSKSFSAGTIYSTPETARLVQLKLKVPEKRLQTANFGEPFQVSNCTVTFVPANHCPGAAMVVFQRPRQAPVLHCGDCRYHAHMFQSRPELQALKHKAILHLDTTYCAPKHQFPLQAEVVTEVVRLVRAAFEKQQSASRRPPLLVFGSYTIGKERIFMEVALAMNKKVYVEQDKWNVLRCLDMRVRERELITRNMNEAGIHVVPMRQIRSDKLKERLDKHGGFGAVIAFKPTGWTFNGDTADASEAVPSKTPSLFSNTPAANSGHAVTVTGAAAMCGTSVQGVNDHNAIEAATNKHANTSSDREADCHAHRVGDGQHGLEEVACGTAAEDDAFESEYELDEDDKALFELDVSGDKENGGAMQPSIRKSADDSVVARQPQRCFDVLCSGGLGWAAEDAEPDAFSGVPLDAPVEDPAATENPSVAAGSEDPTLDDVIDLCNSQCSPPLQLPALQRNRMNDCSKSGASVVNTGALHSSRLPLKENSCNVTAPAAAQNALQYLMQPARKSAKELNARSEARATESTPANAFSIMRSAQKTVSKQHGRRSGKGKRGSAAAVGVDKDACAPWVSVKSSGAVQILEVPYSEHSSFNELREFVSWLQPIAVVPTVGGSASATPSMLQMLGQTVGRA